jgi:hypothetical protein
MSMTLDEVRAGFRDGSIMMLLPAAHADVTSEFLERFSERILKLSWYDVADRAHLKIPVLVDNNSESEEALADAIEFEYGADVSDLHGLSLWNLIQRCAEQPRKSGIAS